MGKNTVFVIGAGASAEAKLPTGNKLKENISQLLNIKFSPVEQVSGDPLIVSALLNYLTTLNRAGDIDSYLQEARLIRNALPLAISIDNFIDSHKDNDKIALCGKLAIVRSILQEERKSFLYFERTAIDSTINYKLLNDKWYLPFFQLLTENCCKNDLEERFKSITLIIFNYDRCIEHFMYYALQNYYKVSKTDAARIIKLINIYHPYGCVGALPWQDSNGSMEFGAEPNADKLLQLANKIKTFTEGTDPTSSDIVSIREHMAAALRLVFMGFAFHKLNMQLIKPERRNPSSVDCYATTFEISNSDQEVIVDQIDSIFNKKLYPKMANLSCGEFFKEFWRSLAF